MRVVGGREVHPINLQLGGLHRAPRKAELATLVEGLERAREIALRRRDVDRAGSTSRTIEQDFEMVALAQPGEYPIDRGRVVSDRGLDIPAAEYMDHFVEYHVAVVPRPAFAARRRQHLRRSARWPASRPASTS